MGETSAAAAAETDLAAAAASARTTSMANENQMPASQSIIFIPAPFSCRRGTCPLFAQPPRECQRIVLDPAAVQIDPPDQDSFNRLVDARWLQANGIAVKGLRQPPNGKRAIV